MKALVLVCRILLGILFIVMGANLLFTFLPQAAPPAGSPEAEFFQAMVASGWMRVIGAFQILGGVLVLFEGLVPLALCILCPLTANILCFHMLFTGSTGIVPGMLAALMELVLIYAYRPSFAGILSAHQKPVFTTPGSFGGQVKSKPA